MRYVSACVCANSCTSTMTSADVRKHGKLYLETAGPTFNDFNFNKVINENDAPDLVPWHSRMIHFRTYANWMKKIASKYRIENIKKQKLCNFYNKRTHNRLTSNAIVALFSLFTTRAMIFCWQVTICRQLGRKSLSPISVECCMCNRWRKCFGTIRVRRSRRFKNSEISLVETCAQITYARMQHGGSKSNCAAAYTHT